MEIDSAPILLQARQLDAAREQMAAAQVKQQTGPVTPQDTAEVVLSLSAAAQQLLVKPGG